MTRPVDAEPAATQRSLPDRGGPVISTPYTRLAGVAAHLPDTTLTTAQVEDRLAERNPDLELPRGLIYEGSGVRRRHVASADDKPSDLAVRAVRSLLRDADLQPGDIGLIIYAGVCVDVIEPATGHIVAAKLGASCPVFDVRNACNSVLNAMEVADSLIRHQHYGRIVVCCGELPTAVTPWTLKDAAEFYTVAAAFTVSDAGAALLLEASPTPGVIAHRFVAQSADWDASVVPLHDMTNDLSTGLPSLGPLTIDSVKLLHGLKSIDPAIVHKGLAEHGLTWDDFAVVCVHQASLSVLWKQCETMGIPTGKVIVTISQHGNMVAATLPVQLAMAVQSGRLRRGDLVALLGVASGFSAGLLIARW
ncbi:ketoacyl-ACP synthase III [Actinomadura sp. NPDC047616]|uniref:3-oxoacyl-ACP synthase III family protein n=1 Tax=Actinomadura sp. NPDC047616 TaxID=3155914 RepID=UPI0033DB9FE4